MLRKTYGMIGTCIESRSNLSEAINNFIIKKINFKITISTFLSNN